MVTNYFVFFMLSIMCHGALAVKPGSFSQAKHVVYQIFSNHSKTLYCGCDYNSAHQVDLNSCHMNAASYKKRAHNVEIEHIYPMDAVGHNMVCWQSAICEHHGKRYKGRKCCEKSDHKFRQIESELYNLWPAVGLVNVARSNYSYAKVNSSDKFYGCDFKISKASEEVEPANKIKGIVARATLFMSDKYHVPLDESKRQLYFSWNKAFPPSKWEKEWALKVASIEGYSNPYILVE